MSDTRRKSDDDGRKKRVGKACDSCRMKKTKCDGRKPCSKCSVDNKLCTYSEKKKLQDKTYSSSYVELLECRLQILQESVVKLVSKISHNEDVSQYIPQSDFSINKVIELLMEGEECDDEDERQLRKQAMPNVIQQQFSPPAPLSPNNHHDSESSPGGEEDGSDFDYSAYPTGHDLMGAAMNGYVIDSDTTARRHRRSSSSSKGLPRSGSATGTSPPPAGAVRRSSSASGGIRKPKKQHTLRYNNVVNSIGSTTPANYPNDSVSPQGSSISSASTTNSNNSSTFASDFMSTTEAPLSDPIAFPAQIDLKMEDQEVINPVMINNLDEINTNMDDLWLGAGNGLTGGFYESF